MQKVVSFAQLINATKNYSIADIGEFVDDIKEHYRRFPDLSHYIHHISGMYIFDYTKFEYRYVDNNFARIAERSKEYILDVGLQPKESIWYAPDQKVFTEEMMINNFHYFKEVPVKYHDQYLITCNYRNRTKDNQLKSIQQKSFVIRSSPEGVPLAVLGFVCDNTPTTDVRKNLLYHSIHYVGDATHQPVRNHFRIHVSGEPLFTPREIEILIMLCKGMSNRVIAETVFISEKTVSNHRQNIHRKAQVHNVVELIAYAKDYGFL